MKTNIKPVVPSIFTHEGAKASHINAEQQLRRSIMACMLFEDTFYEDGASIADRIAQNVSQLPAAKVADIAYEARTVGNLRHAPLWLISQMIKQEYPKPEDRLVIGQIIPKVVQRPDELGELVSMYWLDGKKPLTKQMKIGLSNALKKFSEYQLAKYDSDSAKVKIRDVMFLTHPRPDTKEQEDLFKRIASRKLKTPDTWETNLSAGKDKKETFERLMDENKLGVLAFIRNLRNMNQAGIERNKIKEYSQRVKLDKALPFRFVAAARACPDWSDIIENMMISCLEQNEKLKGKTIIIVDNSVSMNARLSAKSDLCRTEAAGALAVLVKEICEEAVVIGYGNSAKAIPNHYKGFSLMEQIQKGPSGGTDTRKAIELAEEIGYDRIIVITDEQTSSRIPNPSSKLAYFINIATYKNGVGYGSWNHIDGFSESTIEWIRAFESQFL